VWELGDMCCRCERNRREEKKRKELKRSIK
jgi:hypothetical protein